MNLRSPSHLSRRKRDLTKGEKQRRWRARRNPVSIRRGELKVPMDRVRALGYRSYADYLFSPHWAHVKVAYHAAGRPLVCLCGRKGKQLHHLTYAHLGAEHEHLEDVRMICGLCHLASHDKTLP